MGTLFCTLLNNTIQIEWQFNVIIWNDFVSAVSVK